MASSVFNDHWVPRALQHDHNTKAGIWARAGGENALTEPEVPHHVHVIGPVVFQPVFYGAG